MPQRHLCARRNRRLTNSADLLGHPGSLAGSLVSIRSEFAGTPRQPPSAAACRGGRAPKPHQTRPTYTMASSDLQNSYGPEMTVRGQDLPQAVVHNGLEPMHPGQHAALAPPYSEQHAKNNQYNNSHPGASTQPDHAGQKRRVLGLPVALFWGIVIGLVLILAIGLGVGLGVGLSQRNSSGGSAAAATSSTSADAATTSAPSSTTSGSSITSTSSATSAAATARNVEICNQASLVSDCTNLTVPVNTCGMSSCPSGLLQVAGSQRRLMLTYGVVGFISGLSNGVQR